MARLLLVCLVWVSTSVFALDLELTEGVNKAFPMGIDGFGKTKEGRELTAIIDKDLRFSGQFKLIPAPRVADGKAPLDLWQQVGVDSVLSGQVESREDGRYGVHVELVDVAARGRSLISKDYQVSGAELPALAHHISDEVYQELTGVRGVFSTRIAYVFVKRQGNKSIYSLEIANIDGSNSHALVTSSAPIMSPAWSPDGRQIAYVSFEKRRAQVFIISVETAKRRLITDFDGINGAPAWSPDGKDLAIVLSKSGAPKIYKVNLSTGAMKQLTFGMSIDTEPRYAADGQSLVFTSGRGGAPQVYRLDFADGAVSRLTFEGNYNARPSYTPDQKHLVMLHREDRQFNIGTQVLDTGEVTILTNSEADEAPSVAPNGRYVIYATHQQGRGMLGLVSLDGEVKMLYPARDGDIQEPAWSPFFG
ncbi:MAG: Tol-Pal system beta propeller repeat protein TolB [Gammaproteobacteria bacterium]|nr:Tol-Pal system beta propeller repeat protein TolB [Gammaproteobacteria bacterium]